jgi:hypothetical protein
VEGVVFNGLRHDTGDKADHLRAVVRLAYERPDLGPEFVTWLRGFLGELDGARPGHRNVAARHAKAPAPGRGPRIRDSPVSRWAAGSTPRSSRR